MGMDENSMASLSIISLERADRLLEIMGQLEEFAVEFPESREGVMGLIEQFSGKSKGSEKALRDTVDRIAAMGMLEILHSE